MWDELNAAQYQKRATWKIQMWVIEIDEEASRRSLLEVGLEEYFVPVDLAELHVPLRGREVDEPFL